MNMHHRIERINVRYIHLMELSTIRGRPRDTSLRIRLRWFQELANVIDVIHPKNAQVRVG